jgi:hypothetical protein
MTTFKDRVFTTFSQSEGLSPESFIRSSGTVGNPVGRNGQRPENLARWEVHCLRTAQGMVNRDVRFILPARTDRLVEDVRRPEPLLKMRVLLTTPQRMGCRTTTSERSSNRMTGV